MNINIAKEFESKLKYFTLKFIIRTEGISYFIIVPILILFIFINIPFTNEQFGFFALCAAFAFPISFITTQLNNIIVTKPVQK